MIRRLLILNSILLALMLVAAAVLLLRIKKEVEPKGTAEPTPRLLVYTQSGRDLLVEDIDALKAHYDFAELPDGRMHMDDFQAGRSFAYEIFKPLDKELPDGDLFVFETEFGTSFATSYDIEALAGALEFIRRLERTPQPAEGGPLFPDEAGAEQRPAEGVGDPFEDAAGNNLRDMGDPGERELCISSWYEEMARVVENLSEHTGHQFTPVAKLHASPVEILRELEAFMKEFQAETDRLDKARESKE